MHLIVALCGNGLKFKTFTDDFVETFFDELFCFVLLLPGVGVKYSAE